jgi:hypothetical protein
MALLNGEDTGEQEKDDSVHDNIDSSNGLSQEELEELEADPDADAEQYFPVPPQFLQDWPESCRTPQDSAGLQAKVLIFVASPAKLGRAQQSLGGLSANLGRTWQSLAGLDRIQTELCRIYFKLEYITKK